MGEEPRPRSPPGYVDLYGKRRQQAKLQSLQREISLLQEELKSLDAVPPTSNSCKELNEFLATKPDPLISVNQKTSKSDCSWKSFSGCCGSEDAGHQQVKKIRCCCSRENRSQKCCGLKECLCFSRKYSSFKLCCSSNCCKVNLCPNCARNCSCSGSCCL